MTATASITGPGLYTTKDSKLFVEITDAMSSGYWRGQIHIEGDGFAHKTKEPWREDGRFMGKDTTLDLTGRVTSPAAQRSILGSGYMRSYAGLHSSIKAPITFDELKAHYPPDNDFFNTDAMKLMEMAKLRDKEKKMAAKLKQEELERVEREKWLKNPPKPCPELAAKTEARAMDEHKRGISSAAMMWGWVPPEWRRPK